MATFGFRCSQHPAPLHFDAPFAVGQAPDRMPCPECGAHAPRVYSVPRISLNPAHLVAAIDRTERSRWEPDVVSGPPPEVRPRAGGRASAAINPAWYRLPRP